MNKVDPLLAYFQGGNKDDEIVQFARRYKARPPCRCPKCGMKYDHRPLTGLCYNGCRRLTMKEQ